jgi:hypothetical protein
MSELSRRSVGMRLAIEGLVPTMRPAAVVQPLVLSLVDGKAEQPGGELRIAAKVSQRAESTQEYILGHLFGEGALPELAQTHGVDAVLVSEDQLTECRRVTLLHPSDEVFV